jgi:hypothetical protein
MYYRLSAEEREEKLETQPVYSEVGMNDNDELIVNFLFLDSKDNQNKILVILKLGRKD